MDPEHEPAKCMGDMFSLERYYYYFSRCAQCSCWCVVQLINDDGPTLKDVTRFAAAVKQFNLVRRPVQAPAQVLKNGEISLNNQHANHKSGLKKDSPILGEFEPGFHGNAP